jgi:hypothetical protein
LPDNNVCCIAIDGSGNKWIGMNSSGLVKFDGTHWTVYTDSNSGLPNNWITSISIDGSGNIWIGTQYSGLAKFDGTTWASYNSSNSGLLYNLVRTLAIDASGTKWIGNELGLSVFHEGGLVTSVSEIKITDTPTRVCLSQNYPNPFTSTTTIRYKVTEPSLVSLKVFNAMGTEVATLINEKKPVGEYSIDWNASGLRSGMYFCRLQSGTFSETQKLVLQK